MPDRHLIVQNVSGILNELPKTADGILRLPDRESKHSTVWRWIKCEKYPKRDIDAPWKLCEGHAYSCGLEEEYPGNAEFEWNGMSNCSYHPVFECWSTKELARNNKPKELIAEEKAGTAKYCDES